MSNNQMPLKWSLYAAFLCMIFGGNSVAIKFSLTGFGAFTNAGIRFTISALVLLLWALFRKYDLKVSRKQIFQLFILSQLFFLQSSCLYLGLTRTTASHGILISNLTPFFTLVLAHLFIPGDRITIKKGVGMTLGFLGVAILFFDHQTLSSDIRTGNFMIFFASFFWGCNTVYAKNIISDYNLAQITLYPMIFSIPFFFSGGYFWDTQMIKNINPTVIKALLYQSLLIASYGFIAWNSLLHRFGATSLQSFIFLMPLTGVSFGILLLGEPVTIYLFFSVILVISGITTVNAKINKRNS